MPPKKQTQPKTGAESAPQKSKGEPKVEKHKQEHDSDKQTSNPQIPAPKPKQTKQAIPQKRQAKEVSDTSNKTARRSTRGTSKPQPNQAQLLQYLLSSSAQDLCRSEDEKTDISKRGPIKTYTSSKLKPFEELLCAVILSRPISHRLGMRSIRTLLNDPYNFTSAKAIQKAGKDQHHQALWDARTQHKGKTAEQMGLLADVVLEKFTADGDEQGTELGKVLGDGDGDVDAALDALRSSIKGLGDTGLNIFVRRVQWVWEDVYPFVDERTAESLVKLGLPGDAEQLRELLEKHWEELETKDVGGNGESQKKRVAFVTILERAVGADLEHKTDQLVEAASSTS